MIFIKNEEQNNTLLFPTVESSFISTTMINVRSAQIVQKTNHAIPLSFPNLTYEVHRSNDEK